jgi:hypothetical protein
MATSQSHPLTSPPPPPRHPQAPALGRGDSTRHTGQGQGRIGVIRSRDPELSEVLEVLEEAPGKPRHPALCSSTRPTPDEAPPDPESLRPSKRARLDARQASDSPDYPVVDIDDIDVDDVDAELDVEQQMQAEAEAEAEAVVGPGPRRPGAGAPRGGPDAAAIAAHGQAAALDAVNGEEPEPPPKPVPMQYTNWALYKQPASDPILDPSFCFACHFAQSKQEYSENKRIEDMRRFATESRDHMHPFLFAKEMQHIYNTTVRPYLQYRGMSYAGPAWPARNIYEHALSHKPTPGAWRQQIARTLLTAMKTMEENGLFLADGTTGARRVDPRVLDAYNKTYKEVKPLLKELESHTNGDLYGF